MPLKVISMENTVASGQWDRWGEYVKKGLENAEIYLAHQPAVDPAPAGKVLCQLLFLAGRQKPVPVLLR